MVLMSATEQRIVSNRRMISLDTASSLRFAAPAVSLPMKGNPYVSRNDHSNTTCVGLCWSRSRVASQSGLGLRAQRRAGCSVSDPGRAACTWTNLILSAGCSSRPNVIYRQYPQKHIHLSF